MKIEIIVSEHIMKKVSPYACECQRTKICMEEKTGIVFWRKKPGDVVEIGDVLCEIELEKNIGEVKSTCAGRLAEQYIEDGGECTLGSVLGILET